MNVAKEDLEKAIPWKLSTKGCGMLLRCCGVPLCLVNIMMAGEYNLTSWELNWNYKTHNLKDGTC